MLKKGVLALRLALSGSHLDRRTCLAMTGVATVFLLVSGALVVLGLWISRNNEAAHREHVRLQAVERIHTTCFHLLLELRLREASGDTEHAREVPALIADLRRDLQELSKPNALGAGAGDEPSAFAELRRSAKELMAIVEGPANPLGTLGRPHADDLKALHEVSHEIARHAGEVRELRRASIARLQEESRRALRLKVALYVALTLIGLGFILGAGRIVSRTFSAPLRALADAAERFSEGRWSERVPVGSRDEIGKLSRAFNVMAEKLEAHEQGLSEAREHLERRMRESQDLCRIGTEVSALHEQDRVLRLVVDRARELLRCEAAALCMLSPGRNGRVPLAAGGPTDLFQHCRDAGCAIVGREELGAGRRACPVVSPEYQKAHLSAELRSGGVPVGLLHVFGTEARAFTSADAELLQDLARVASIALENARLYGEMRSLAALEERERIGREMHDGLAQVLGLLYTKLRAARTCVDASELSDLPRAFGELMAITEEAYDEVRLSILGYGSVQGSLELVPALTAYVREFSARTAIAVDVRVAEGGPIAAHPPLHLQIVRIVQEALNNVRTHAQAHRASVSLERRDGCLRVTIEDDGRGYNPGAVRADDRLHFGVQGMRERAESVGGRLEIDSKPGRGTRVRVTVPAHA